MKIFKFVPSPEVDPDHKAPVPMKGIIPEWYRNAERYYSDKHGMKFEGLKTCVPFLDAMISGYALVLPVNMYVTKDENDEIKITWDKIETSPVNERMGLTGHTIPRPPGHEKNHLAWTCQWGWKVPKGYSVLLTHPVNRFDLPFTTMSGIVDSEEFMGWGNVPFFIKSGFEGVIPAGTPIAQLIPIKREKWVYAQSWGNTAKQVEIAKELRRGEGVYKKLFRKEKEY